MAKNPPRDVDSVLHASKLVGVYRSLKLLLLGAYVTLEDRASDQINQSTRGWLGLQVMSRAAQIFMNVCDHFYQTWLKMTK